MLQAQNNLNYRNGYHRKCEASCYTRDPINEALDARLIPVVIPLRQNAAEGEEARQIEKDRGEKCSSKSIDERSEVYSYIDNRSGQQKGNGNS